MKNYIPFHVDGIDIYLSQKVQAKDEGITIYVEKIFFKRRLQISGVDIHMR